MADPQVKPYWGDDFRPFVQAWREDSDPVTESSPPTLTELADAIVQVHEYNCNRGASICHAIVPELRTLIEAVQAHPDARLAEIGPDGKPTIDNPTPLQIHGGEIASCDCSNLHIKISIELFRAPRFTSEADFQRAVFTSRANFFDAIFTSRANFSWATFTAETDFSMATFAGPADFISARFNHGVIIWYVTFIGEASFSSVTFTDSVYFKRVLFTGKANFSWATFADWTLFEMATFKGEANFNSTTFTGPADFSSSSFAGSTIFASMTLERRLTLSWARIEPGARLSFRGADIRPGAVITVPSKPVRRIELRSRSSARDWWDESTLGTREHRRRVLFWLVQYLITIAAPWLDDIWPWLRRSLSVFSHGTFIVGEDSDNSDELRKAAGDYNLLRDIFRHQTSADELEDLCHFRYMDLRRKAGDLWMQAGPRVFAQPKITVEMLKPFLPDKSTHAEVMALAQSFEAVTRSSRLKWFQWFAFDGVLYWFIWRNCLGYLVRPMRPLVTSLVVIALWAFFYGAWASNDTIIYSGTLPEGATTAMDVWGKSSILTPLYFSVTTFTTLGYGDFAPTGWLRGVASIQAALGVTLIALFTVSWGRKMIR